MDKSEGTDVISKFFGSISDGLSKLYLKGQQRLTYASLKRMRSEKIVELGSKLFKLLAAASPVSADLFKEEYEAIVRIDSELKAYEESGSVEPADSTAAPKPRGRRGGRRKQTVEAAVEKTAPKPRGRRGGRKKQTVESTAAPKPRGRRGGRRKAADNSAANLPVVITSENEKSGENFSAGTEANPTETTDSKE
jgi:hypothetical protein